MANPINSSDLLNLDGTLLEAKKRFDALTASMDKMEKKAHSLVKGLEGVNETNSEGQAEIVKTTKQADKLSKAYDALAEAADEQSVKVAALKETTRQFNNVNKLEAKLLAAKEGSYNKLSAQYSLNKIRLNQLSKAERETTDEGKKLVKESNNIYQEMKRLQEETGKNVLSVGDYGRAIEHLGGPFAAVIRDAKMFRAGLTAQVASLRASVTGLGGVSKALKIFKLALISTGIGAFVVILGSLATFLTKTQTGMDMVNKVFDQLGAVVSVVIDRIAGFGEGLVDIFNGRFEEGANKLRAAVKGVGEEIRNEAKAAGDLRDELTELEKAEQTFVLTKSIVEKKISELRKKAAQEEATDKKKAAQLNKEAEEAIESLYEQEINLARKRAEIVNAQLALGNSTRAEIQEGIEATAKLNQLEAARNDRQRTLIKQQTTLNKATSSGSKATDEAAEAQEAMNKLLLKSVVESYTPADKAIQEINNRLQEYNELVAKGAQANPDFVSEMGKQFDLIKLKVESTIKNLKPLAGRVGTETGEEFVARMGEAMSDEQIGPQEGGSIFDTIKDLFDDPDFKKGVGAVASSLDFAKQQLSSFLQARVDFTDKVLEQSKRLSDQRTEDLNSLQQELTAEISNRDAGLANRVATVQAEIQLARTAQDEARKNEEKALAAREKAVKQQQKLETISQASNLITAIAKTLSQVPFPFNIVASGIMLGSFAASKIQAAKLAKQPFAEGGLEIIGGGSHASGNDTFLGFSTASGKQAYGERGEAHMILSKQSTRKYKTLLPELFKTLKDGTFEQHFTNANQAAQMIPFYPPSANVDTTKMESYLSNIKKQGEEKQFFGKNGERILVRGNRTRVYG